MTTSPRRDTAKIYQFPTRPRHAGAEPRRPERTGPVPVAPVCDTGAWYHEAAIQEDHRGRRP